MSSIVIWKTGQTELGGWDWGGGEELIISTNEITPNSFVDLQYVD